MYVDVNTIITAGSLLTAVVVIFSAVFAVYKWYLRQNEQDRENEIGTMFAYLWNSGLPERFKRTGV